MPNLPIKRNNSMIFTLWGGVVFCLILTSFLIQRTWVAGTSLLRTHSVVLEAQELYGKISTWDEVLTQEMKNYALTQDPKSKQRYIEFNPLLGDAIDRLVTLAPGMGDPVKASETKKANDDLVALEQEAQYLVDSGNAEAAIKILSGDKYSKAKARYASGYREDKIARDLFIKNKWEQDLNQIVLLCILTGLSLFATTVGWLYGFMFLSSMIEKGQQSIKKQKEESRIVLDSIEDGIFIVDRNGNISESKSKSLSTWFEDSSNSAWHFLFPNDERKAKHFQAQYLDVWDNPILSEYYLKTLPSTNFINGFNLQYRYIPIEQSGEINQILVHVVDTTSEIKEIENNRKQRNLLKTLGKSIENPNAFNDFTADSKSIFSSIKAAIIKNDSSRMLHHLHTIKGNMMVYHLEDVANACHSLETFLISSVKSKSQFSSDYISTNISEIENQFDVEIARITELTGSRNRDSEINISISEYDKLLEKVKAYNANSDLQQYCQSLQWSGVRYKLESLESMAYELAQRLKKDNLSVKVFHNDVRIQPKLEGFWSSLVHVVRNAVDYAVENQDSRIKVGKDPYVTLKMTSSVTSENIFVVSFEDDGPGIDYEKIKLKVKDHGIDTYSEKELNSAIFSEGITSRSEVSLISGRGIGLAAVKYEVEKLKGRIFVDSQLGRGTNFTFHIPLQEISFEPGASNVA
ncbi:MAG: hypothetical protein EOO46_10035 [Flavobacterium sp.]|nr:MAG: hypothetical protein EOO46_10035 [Flavobacterium sp.]